MKKRIMTMAMAALVLGCSVGEIPASYASVYTEEVKVYDQYAYREEDGHIVITECNKDLTEAVIPSEIDGLPVTEIGTMAFSGCKSLKYVSIPESVTRLNGFAFSGCTALASVILPENLEIIGVNAFSGCTKLSVLNIPEKVNYIGSDAFEDTLWLTAKREYNPLVSANGILFDGKAASGAVHIPDSVTYIADDTFAGNRSILSVTVPDSVTSIGNGVFRNCGNLSEVNIAERVTNFGAEVFTGTKWLKDKMKESAIVIVNGVIVAVDAEAMNVAVPDGISDLGYWMNGNRTLITVTLPSSMTVVNERAFQNCPNLRIVSMSDGVEEIGDYAFADCESLVSADLPDSVTRIGYAAFQNTGLTSFTVPENVNSIGATAFYECEHLTSITIPPSVTEIGGYAFWGCDYLTIYGTVGSYAETYAKENNIPFRKAAAKPGDINEDGVVNLKDVVILRRYIAGGWGIEL